MKISTLGSVPRSSSDTGYFGIILDPTALKTRSRSKIGSFLVLLMLLLAIILPDTKLLAQNIQGLAPVQTPLGGYAIDGNAYVNLPVAGDIPGGDLFFERTTPVPLATANPGGLFVPSYFSNPPVSLGVGEFTYESNPEVLLYPNTFLFRDDITNNDPTIFTSSNKIDDDPTTYTWGSGSSPNKNEIQSAIAHFTYGEETLGGDPDDLWMIFAADREVTNGSSYIDFEILQNTLTREGTTSGSFSSSGPDGGRTLGDILVTIEFTQGGGEATAVIRRWEASGDSFAYNIYTAFPVGTIYISNNTVATIVPYSIYNQSPLSSGQFSGYYQYSINQWAEGAVNVSELFGQGDDPCLQISTLFIRTRTSGNSGQSELKDFPGKPIQLNLDLTPDAPEVGNVENCGPWQGTLDATGCEGTVKWYDMQSGGELLHTGASYDPGEITETTSFWVSCTVNGCEGSRAEVIITIIDNPVLDPISNVTACDSYDLPAVGSISGSNLVSPKYYDDSQANGGSVITDLTLTSSQTVWVYDETGTTPNCSDEISFTVTINDSPELDPISNVTACDSYDLPAVGSISGSNLVSPKYYDDSQANGGSVITDLTLTSSQTVWVYDETGTTPNCSDEISFTVTINDSPELDPISNVTACDSYDLPAVGSISGTNLVSPKYYDDSQANGGSVITDLTLISSQTVWVYDETGTTPNCSDEISFTVTINDSPELDPISNVTACDSYDLPAVGSISGTNLVSPKYYDDSQANGGSVITDLTLTSSQTVWVYDETGTTPNCSDEISFTVTINDSPELDPISNVTACDSYDLPAVGSISGTNLVSPKYYDDSQANGGSVITDLTLTSSQTVWVYDETGTTPNCSDEISFTVTINDTPELDPISNVTACDSYDLPAVGSISGTNLVSPKYYDDSQANGGSVITDLTLTSSQTVWVYDETGTTPNCSDEISFTVTINDSPELDPISNVTACDSYDLPAVGSISGTNLVSPKYYDDSQANGGSVITDLTLTSSQTVWVYDETGTTPNCSDEISFTVTINDSPQILTSNPEPLCVGESVDLANYVSNPDAGKLSYYLSQEDADGGEVLDQITSLVSPGLGSTDYFVRSENNADSDCYDTAKITVTVITCITGEGCTLGYWKNHTDRWCDAYTTCTLYGDVFSSAPNPNSPKKLNIYNLTLLEVLNLGGNTSGENLARQSVAALLNTCSELVGFEYYSISALIDDVNAAWEGNPNTVKSFAIYLDDLNNAYCPLGGSTATTAASPACEAEIVGTSSALKLSQDVNETSVVVNSFKVYPVPFKEYLNIQYDFDYSSAAKIEMFDLQGRLLRTYHEVNAYKGKVTELNIDFRARASQVYVIKITTDRDIFTKKVISDK